MTDKFSLTTLAGHAGWRAALLAGSAFLTLSFIAEASAQVATPHITVDPSAGAHPTLGHSERGVEQVDIVGANAAGLSHNRFTDYNVSESGLILNNATAATQTQIGGKVSANANLNGTGAKVIFAEVTGGNATTLAGTTEVAGHQAAVVVANPNGIACSGCGFVNTSRATLTTGKPLIDDSGALKSLQASAGEVTFQGSGGDFTNVPVLDIVSRTVTVKGNAKLQARKVNVVAGRNTVDYADVTKVKQMKPNPEDKAPEFAVDTSAMGGVYADRIYMVVNENGAGVRVNGDMAANIGDVDVSAAGNIINNGHIEATQGRVTLAVAGNLSNGERAGIESEGDLSASVAGTISNAGVINARSGQAALSSAGSVANGKAATISGGRDVSVQSAGDTVNDGKLESQNGALAINAAGGIRNRAGDMRAKSGVKLVTAGAFDNDGTIQNGGGDLYISSVGNVQNRSNITNIGSGKRGKTTFQSTGQFKNSGTISTDSSDVEVQALSSLANSGSIEAKAGAIKLASTTGSVQNVGRINADNGADLNAGGAMSNRGGTIESDSGSVKLTTSNWSDFDNVNGTVRANAGNIAISTRNIANSGGTVFAAGNLTGSGGKYSADKSSVFRGEKAFKVSFTGTVQKAGQYGLKGADVAQVAPEAGASNQGNTSVQMPSIPVVKVPQTAVVMPAFSWGSFNQGAWGGYYW